MKKNYSKPEILFEDFSASCNIASCEIEANSAWNACGYYVENTRATVFVSPATGCNDYHSVIPWGDDSTDGNYGKICYHVPDGYNLFGS